MHCKYDKCFVIKNPVNEFIKIPTFQFMNNLYV